MIYIYIYFCITLGLSWFYGRLHAWLGVWNALKALQGLDLGKGISFLAERVCTIHFKALCHLKRNIVLWC